MPEKSKKTTRKPVGLIGVGLMGHAMATRLRDKNFDVVGFDVSSAQCDALSKLGGKAASNASSVFAECERVILSLPDDKIVSSVLRETAGSLHPRHIIIDTSTGSPEPAIENGKKLQARGVTYLDATISGNSEQVKRAEVLVMVGGLKTAFLRCRDIFETFSATTIHTGSCGSGAKMKLVTNLVLGLNRVALAEGFVFARALGLDARQALSVLRNSMAYSRMMDVKGEKMLNEDFKPQARLSQHLKDVRLMIAAAGKTGTKLPLSAAHRKVLEFAEAQGLGQMDNSAVIRAIENMRGGK
jgi:3-hydroxyisobutyrate dehydrogenase-like beta-hydroxyacid dehydrogenase